MNAETEVQRDDMANKKSPATFKNVEEGDKDGGDDNSHHSWAPSHSTCHYCSALGSNGSESLHYNSWCVTWKKLNTC